MCTSLFPHPLYWYVVDMCDAESIASLAHGEEYSRFESSCVLMFRLD